MLHAIELGCDWVIVVTSLLYKAAVFLCVCVCAREKNQYILSLQCHKNKRYNKSRQNISHQE